MNAILSSIATGFLVRADGWGPINHEVAKSWHPCVLRASKFFNVWSCAALYVMICLVLYTPIVALACGAAFVLFRLPGFNPWQVWRYMFLRGLWTTAAGFFLLCLATDANFMLSLLCVPFAAIYATIYSGGYKWLPQKILGLDRHVWIEHASGWQLHCFIMLIAF